MPVPFKATPARRGFSPEQQAALFELEVALEKAIVPPARPISSPTGSDVRVKAGEHVRVTPASSTPTLLLPNPAAIDPTTPIHVTLERVGTFRLRASDGLVNGVATITFAAPGLYTLRSDGKASWWVSAFGSPGSITTAMLADGSVTTIKIADDAVTAGKFRNMQGYSAFGKSTTGAGNGDDITSGTDAVLSRLNGADLVFNDWTSVTGQGLHYIASRGIGAMNYERRRVGFTDDFLHVPSATLDAQVTTGAWEWFFNVISLPATASLAATTSAASNHPGIARFSLTALSGTCSFCAGSTDTDPVCTFDDFERVDCILRIITSLTGAFFQFGVASTTNDMRTSTHGAWIEYNQGSDTDLHARTRDGSADTSDTDCGSSSTVALNGWMVLSIRKASNSDLEFYLNDLLETTVAAATHGIDGTDSLNLGFYFDNVLTALAFDVDYFRFNTPQLSSRT